MSMAAKLMPWSIVSVSKRAGPKPKPKFICCSAQEFRKLILYSKPGCCLCDGLKEKLSAALSNVDLEIRDITTHPEWERAYQYEIPVLAVVRSDGTEEKLPRLSPRLGVEVIRRKVEDAFRQ